MEEGSGLSQEESGGDGHDEDQDSLLGQAEGERVEETGDGVESQVCGAESDDGFGNAEEVCGVKLDSLNGGSLPAYFICATTPVP